MKQLSGEEQQTLQKAVENADVVAAEAAHKEQQNGE